MKVVSYEIVSDGKAGQGGFLSLRRLRLRARLDDGSVTREGLYDYVERPVGLDAVVLALWTRGPDGRVRVLLRDGLRVPLIFDRGGSENVPRRFTEVVAGILEEGETGPAAIAQRAAAEAHEEAGLRVEASKVMPLGPAMYPTPGMCPELFHLVACEVSADQAAAAEHPPGDGSPFEEGAQVRWELLDEALAACARGEILDMKTELILRRLKEKLGA